MKRINQFVGKYDFPLLKKTDNVPTELLPFDKIGKTKSNTKWIHFYIDDYKFERIWNSPNKYINVFKRFPGIIGPDFSVYTDMPVAHQIWWTIPANIAIP